MSEALYVPLAEKLRPQTLEDIIGQAHVLGPFKALRLRYESGHPQNMIFWGPPGVGKTTLARLAANYFNAKFIAISAVLGGVKDIRELIEEAKINKEQGFNTLVFIDEIHRFNKSQQDSLLPFTESGLITLIGATTENPSFEVNRALLSRSEVYVLNALTSEDLALLLQKAWGIVLSNFSLDIEVSTLIINYADGDARRLINTVESLSALVLESKIEILDVKTLHTFLGEKLRKFDKGGEVFYDQISALHKSVRGSNPDAALYWFTRMVDGGTDMAYLSRRIIRMAYEDIGLADPRAIQIANDAAMTFERLGSPEGELALASAVVYLSIAAKSNAVYKAFKAAQAFVKNDVSREVPLHLRNAPTTLMKNLNYGTSYRYAHDEPYAYAAGESYWPSNLAHPPTFYTPTDRGLESKIQEKLNFLHQLDAKSSQRKK